MHKTYCDQTALNDLATSLPALPFVAKSLHASTSLVPAPDVPLNT